MAVETVGASDTVEGWMKAPYRIETLEVAGTGVRFFKTTHRSLVPPAKVVDGRPLIDMPTMTDITDSSARIDELGGVEITNVTTVKLSTREATGIGWPDAGHVFGPLGVEAGDVDRSLTIADPAPPIRMRVTETITPHDTTIKVGRDPATQLPPAIPVAAGVDATHFDVAGFDARLFVVGDYIRVDLGAGVEVLEIVGRVGNRIEHAAGSRALVGPDPGDPDADPAVPPTPADAIVRAPGFVHIGVEAIKVTGWQGSNADPDHADPYRFNVDTRGALGTTAVTHRVVAELGMYPELTGRPTEWTNRRCRISIFGGYKRGINLTPGPEFHLVPGRMLKAADVDDGIVSVEVIKISALIDRDVSIQPTRTTLVEGWAEFDGDRAAHLVATFRLPYAAYSALTTADSLAASGDLIAPYAAHSDIFDPVGQPAGSPRAGALDADGQTLQPIGYSDPGGVPQFDLGANQPVGTVRSDRVVNSAVAIETVSTAPLDGFYQWPLDVLAAAETAWGTHPWVGLHLTFNSDTALSVTLEGGLQQVGGRKVIWADPYQLEAGDRRLFGFDPYPWPEDLGTPPGPLVSGAYLEDRLRPWQELYYPFNRGNRAGDDGTFEGTRFHEFKPRNPRATPFDGAFEYPAAFYQRGQTSFLVPADITPADAEPDGFNVTIAHYDPWTLGPGGDPVEQRSTARIAGIAPAALPDGQQVHRATLHADSVDALPSFGAWPGLPEPVIALTSADDRMTGGALLDRLLSDPDLLGLGAEEVNSASLDRVSDAVGEAHGMPRTAKPLALRDVVRGIVMGNSALVVQPGPNGARLTRGSLGRGIISDVVLELTKRQISGERYGTSGERIDGLELRSNFDANGDAQLVQRFDHWPAQASAGGDRRVETLDMWATFPSDPDDMIPVALVIFDSMRRERRTAKLFASITVAGHLAPTSLIRVTHPRIRSRVGLGVNQAMFRVMGTSHQHGAGRVELDLKFIEADGAGYAPCMKVVEIIDADKVRVAEAEYAPTEDVQGRSPRDIDWFANTRVVWCARNGDQDADDGGAREARRVIVSLDTVQLIAELGPYDGGPGGHGFDARLGDIEPAEYLLQPDLHQQYAALAASNDKIPDGGDGTAGHRTT